MQRAVRAALRLWLSLVLAAVLVIPATPVAAQAAQGETAPRLVKTLAREQVWLIAGGQRQWVADLATFQARGYRWSDVDVIAPAALYALPLRAADHVGPLLSDPASGSYYLVADGAARRVPDLVSFEAYGLDWRRVEPATAAALARYPQGGALPHAVAGRVFPEPPASPSLSTGSPSPAAPARAAPVIDPDLQPALALIAAYAPTASWPAFLRDRGVPVRFGPLTGAHAAYRAEDRTMTVSDQLRGTEPKVLATLLVHETLHAIYDARGISGESGRACVDEEADAFAIQSAFWASVTGLAGAPAPGSPVVAELNDELRWTLDDALFGKVLTTWAYTSRCYFPELLRAPDE